MWPLHLLSCFRVNDTYKEVCGIVSNFLPTHLPSVNARFPAQGSLDPQGCTCLTLNNSDLHRLRRLIFCPNNPPAEVGTTVFKFCFWDAEIRILMKILLASAILEILDLYYRSFPPAVTLQLNGLSRIYHPFSGLEQQPAWKTQREHRPRRPQHPAQSSSEGDAHHPGPEGQWNSSLGAILI